MQIIRYPHPTLRYSSKTIRRVDAELKRIVSEMFELMYEAQGVGLAANQVDLPLRLFVANLAARPDDGEQLVFLNPVVTHAKGLEEAEEGCLSLPGLYGPVMRPKQVRISAYNLAGEEIRQDVTGLLARVVQHEFDHLNGVLFIDRMEEDKKLKLTEDLLELEAEYDEARHSGDMPANEVLASQREVWERKYC